MNANQIHKGLTDNAEAVHSDSVTWEEFSDRNRGLWMAAREYGVVSEVASLLRGEA